MSTGDAIERDEDRLPWLETVDDSYDDRPPVGRLIVLILIGLGVVAAAIAGIYWYQDRPVSGTGELIAAPQGEYKVRPDAPGGMQVAGEGDSVFATSEGGASNASVDLAAMPEAPVAPVQGAPVPAAAPSPTPQAARVGADVPPPAGRLRADLPTANAPVAAAKAVGGGAVVQLGSFPNAASANAAWKQLSGRFSYLAGLGQTVQAAEVGGRTVHRLRVNAGSAVQAREICGKLKVAGEACFIAS